MFLGFDIGNTNTLLGIYNDSSVIPEETMRYKTEKNISSKKLGHLIKNLIDKYNSENKTDIIINNIAFSSVVPELNQKYHDISTTNFNIQAFEINYKKKLKISIRYKNQEELGVDRIVNAEAALNEYGGDSIIIDIGTAATFCILLKDGTFDGGLIAPGVGTTIESLAMNASRLPEVEFEKPDSIIARDTINAIKSGFFYGWISLVEGIISKIEHHYSMKFQIILTGGFSSIIGENIQRKSIVDQLLTMKGVKYIFDYNN